MPKSSFADHLQNQDHNISLYLQPIFVLALHVVPSVDGAGSYVMVPILNELSLSGGRPPVATNRC